MLKDLRFAIRLLLKSPGFAAAAIAAIALGIGANTTVLNLVKRERLVLMLEHFRAQHLDPISVSAFAGARSLTALLYRVSPHDFSTFGLVAVALGTIALLASYVPAARVMRADPMIAPSHNI